uniref:Uncharacterized protein n=1 Tax=Tanacetum cinerariifolium TaxID=118510 RepID=A0A6L2MKL8_TANCI|nr:hypothetical protein [Tanacetum cinerariifolium]
MVLALIAKAFKVNTMPTNNNQRNLLIPRNSHIAQPGMNTSQDIKMQMVDDNVGNQVRHNAVQNDRNEVRQNAVQNSGIHIVENMKGLSVVFEIANHYGNGNVETAQAEGNGNGINGNPISCILQLSQKEEAGIQSTQEEFEFMIAADAHEETERVKVNCTLEDTLQQISTSETQSENALVYDSDGSTEIERLQAQLGDLKGKSSDTHCASDTLDPMSQKLKDKNVSLEFQQSILGKPPSSSYKPKLYSITLFPKSLVLPKVDKMNALSKPVTSNSAPFTRESKVVQTVNVIAPRIFRTNPSKTSMLDNVVSNKPVKTSVRIKPITVSQPNVIFKQQANSDSNGFSSTRVNNTVKTRRPHPRSNYNTVRFPSKSKSSCLSNNLEKIEETHRDLQSSSYKKHMSSECNNITLAIQNAKSKIICVMCMQCLVTTNHDVCVLNYVNDINSHVDNQSANVSIRENKKKHKENANKSKELGSKGSLASSRPSEPRTCLRWIPNRRIFAMCGKLTASSNTDNKSEKSVYDNASTSNPSKPSSKGFSNSASLLGSQNWRDLPMNTPLDRVEVLVFTVTMEILLEPSSNKLLVGISDDVTTSFQLSQDSRPHAHDPSTDISS